MDQDKPKSTIEFKLTPKAKSPSLRLLRNCVLSEMPKDYGSTDLAKTQVLLKAYRNQYYRAITADPSKRRPYTYALNCLPCGFTTHPQTKTCKNPRVCPWCFVRLRLVKAYRALLAVPDWARDGHQVVAWKRLVLDDGKLPFLRANYGPHTWCDALVTVQMVVPFVNESVTQGQPKVQLCHAGVQVVPESCNLKKELGRYCIQPPLKAGKFGEVTPANVVKALAGLLPLEWMALYRDYNLDAFEYLVHGFKRSQLIRISPYKTESADATG
jgi:hypothetical protein